MEENKTPDKQYEEQFGAVDLSPDATKKTVLTEGQLKAQEQLKKIEAMAPVMSTKEEFTSYRLPKLVMPKSFLDFVHDYCRKLEVSEVSFWQMLILDAVNHHLETSEERLKRYEAEKEKTEEILKDIKEEKEKVDGNRERTQQQDNNETE